MESNKVTATTKGGEEAKTLVINVQEEKQVDILSFFQTLCSTKNSHLNVFMSHAMRRVACECFNAGITISFCL